MSGASYSYTLKADSGYQSSMSGRITPEQHGAIVGILGNKDLGQQPAVAAQEPVAWMRCDEYPAVTVSGAVLEDWKRQGAAVRPLYTAAPAAEQPDTVREAEHKMRLLGQALGECIAAAGITRPEADLNGPQLLMFADDLKRYLADQQDTVKVSRVLLEGVLHEADLMRDQANHFLQYAGSTGEDVELGEETEKLRAMLGKEAD